MKSDSIFYKIFQVCPETVFALLQENIAQARDYSFRSVEIKNLAFRIDGIVSTDGFQGRFFLVEVQFHKDLKFYSRLFAELMLFLRKQEASGEWRIFVLFPTRGTDTGIPTAYREFRASERLNIVYLDELPDEMLGTYRIGKRYAQTRPHRHCQRRDGA